MDLLDLDNTEDKSKSKDNMKLIEEENSKQKDNKNFNEDTNSKYIEMNELEKEISLFESEKDKLIIENYNTSILNNINDQIEKLYNSDLEDGNESAKLNHSSSCNSFDENDEREEDIGDSIKK